jgi:hypothetical protein
VVVDALGGIVVHAEQGYVRDRLAVLELLRRQRIAASRASALDSKQIVICGGQGTLTPARLLDGLGNCHRCRDTVPLLRGNRARCDFADECLLSGRVMESRGRG